MSKSDSSGAAQPRQVNHLTQSSSHTRTNLAWLVVTVTAASLLLNLFAIRPVAQAAASVTGSINWGNTNGATTSYSYGVNIFLGWDNDGNGNFVAGNTDYKNNVAFMKNGILRYHRADQMNGSVVSWVDNPTTSAYSWNAGKINGLLSQTLSTNPTRMVDITNWPDYMDDGTGRLRTDQYDAFAAFCAQLVQIVNLDQGHNVQYFEVLNEKDGDANSPYYNNMDELARIYNRAAAAMRAKDSSIKIDGPAFARPDLTDRVETFLANVDYNYFDFVSYHSYESGSTGDPNATIWDKAQTVGRHTTNIKNILSRYTSKAVETFHDEFNISYNPPDDRMTNIKGAIFDALALTSIIKAGATGSMAWNEGDGRYGKVDGWSPYSRRPSANLYNFLNTDMGGNLAQASTSDPSKVDILATTGGSWKKFMLVNRSETDQTIALNFSGWSGDIPDTTQFTVKRVFSWGTTYESATYAQLQSGFNVWADTISFVILDESNKSYATNYVSNNSFENGLNSWSSSGSNPSAAYTEGWAGHTGNHLTQYQTSPYDVYTSQTVTGLANGTYTLTAWVSSGGGQSVTRLEANNYGGSNLSQNIPATGMYVWRLVSIPNLNVSNGQLEVGFRSQADGGQWLFVDDVTLTRN